MGSLPRSQKLSRGGRRTRLEMALVWHSFDREWTSSGNTTPASTEQRINDGFDMNHGRVEKLDACVAGVAQ
jgi:hypothetical protein